VRRSALHKNQNPPLPNLRVIALCYFSYLNFVWNISQWQQKISAWNFIGRQTLMSGSVLHKNHNHPPPYFRVIGLFYTWHVVYCTKHVWRGISIWWICLFMYEKVMLYIFVYKADVRLQLFKPNLPMHMFCAYKHRRFSQRKPKIFKVKICIHQREINYMNTILFLFLYICTLHFVTFSI